MKVLDHVLCHWYSAADHAQTSMYIHVSFSLTVIHIELHYLSFGEARPEDSSDSFIPMALFRVSTHITLTLC